ncbi:MAG: 16S rRNA (guanine(966)-N(2))-methyltransferase RsmD [Candidatus Omnitrophota bacterium]
MRILSGRLKGRRINMPRGIRPTQDKVRKAVFDILREVQGLSFLDLYAGSGAVGLEALSQGASRAVFVESDRRCIEKLRGNLVAAGLGAEPGYAAQRNRPPAGGSYEILKLDALRAIKQLSLRNEKFDFAFLDPPYHQNLAKKTLKILSQYDILSTYGLVICQHSKREALAETEGGLRLLKQSRYGDTLLSFYKKEIS